MQVEEGQVKVKQIGAKIPHVHFEIPCGCLGVPIQWPVEPTLLVED